MHLTTLATCSLNQWALDFDGNTARIIESCRQAKAAGASLRCGPELEIPGYGCLDHFLENDLYLHCWQKLAEILTHPDCHGILVDVGMPVQHRNVRYNCRVIILNRQILLIRPKIWLANDGNYREMRYFTPWQRPQYVEEFYLPRLIREITGITKVPLGDAVISTPDTCLGFETCQELFETRAPHIEMSLNGVEIITNSSASHHEMRKLDTRIRLIQEATRKGGGIYLYANQQGCDGDRLYYDGCAMILVNGDVVAQGSQFSLNDVEVITATVDIEDVRSFRCTPSRGLQATHSPTYQRIESLYSLSSDVTSITPEISVSRPIEPKIHVPEEEIALGPACWLWDYLRRCGGASGYCLALSGGIDSCATAVITFSMCREVIKAIEQGNEQVIKDVRRLCAPPEDPAFLPQTPEILCDSLLHTCYMGTAANSSAETRKRAKQLSTKIGAYHTDMNIDTIVNALTTLFSSVTKFAPRFRAHGGTNAENLALQNIQARLRMVIIYFFAQLLPLVRRKSALGGLLVLGSANVDECLRGYLTKYDCSSADINPIGGISKTDLKKFIGWAGDKFTLPILDEFINATPTAELEPISADYVQSDEVDMGMTYQELSVFGRLRKVHKLGPYGMWTRLTSEWQDSLTPRQVYEKVRRFYYYYAVNRHKMTTITPAYHAEAYSPDDNRFDLRPFLYPAFTWPYRKIEEALVAYETKSCGGKED